MYLASKLAALLYDVVEPPAERVKHGWAHDLRDVGGVAWVRGTTIYKGSRVKREACSGNIQPLSLISALGQE